MVSNEELAATLRRATQGLTANHSVRDLDQTLAEIVTAAVDTVPGVDAGGISMTSDGEVTSRHPTSEAVTRLDERQSELAEGPCITAMQQPPDDGAVVVGDLAGEDAARWPRFAPHAVATGYRSMISCSMNTSDRLRVALNLYAGVPQAFDADARLIAALFGAQAATLLYGSEQAQHLQRAVDSRDVIGQAKGILIERFRVDSDTAFQLLVTSSQETNIKLVDVARWLVDETTAQAPAASR